MTLGEMFPRLRTMPGYEAIAASPAPFTAVPLGPFAGRLAAHPTPPGLVRVGMVSVSDGLGGAEQWISHLLELCDPGRIHWAGIALKEFAASGPTLRANWEACCPVDAGTGVIRDLARSVDVLVAWGVVDRVWGFYRSGLEPLLPPGLPLIEVSHGSIEHPDPDLARYLPRSVAVAVSRAALRGLPEARRATARVILNQVSPARVATTTTREATRSKWGVPPGAKVAGWLGRLSPEKGPSAFVEGIAALPPEWVGVMVGSGWCEHLARAHAAQAAPGRVLFPGPTDQVGDALAAFDCLVMTSETEACSIAAAEAWLAGVPLVSTPVGLLEDHPELAWILPLHPSGAQVAHGVLDNDRDGGGRVERARLFARERLAPERFGREWSELIVSLARRPEVRPEVAREVRLSLLRNACPDAERVPGCGCSDLRLCRRDGARKNREACFRCLEEAGA